MPILCCPCTGRRAATTSSSLDHRRPTPFPVCPPPVKIRKPSCPVEADMPPAAPSLITTPMEQATVDITDLDIDGSDTEDDDRDTRSLSASTLEALKAKLARRLSQRSQDKRRSRNVSEDELARRAELKRLRHKRIQEELQQDEEKCDNSSLIGPRDTIEFIIFDSRDEETPMPASPQLSPVHVSSGSVASWRLSTQLPRESRDTVYVSSAIAEDANTEDQPANESTPADHETTQTAKDNSVGRYSPLDMWLRTQDAQPDSSQGQYSPSHYTTRQNSQDDCPEEIAPDTGTPTQPAGDSMPVLETRSNQPNRSTPAVATSDTSSYKTAPLGAATPEVVLEIRQPSPQDSETSSFKERETELQSVAQRFVGSNIRRDPSKPVISRFHEDFEEPKQSRALKTVIVSKLRPKKGKVLEKEFQPHRNCVADAIQASHLAAAGPNAHIAARGSRTFSTTIVKPPIVETATDLWQRAIRLEADRREAQHREHGHISNTHYCVQEVVSDGKPLVQPEQQPHQPVRKPSSAYSQTHTEQTEMPSGLLSPRSKPAARGNDAVEGLPGSLETSNRVLKEWQHQIQAEESVFERTPSFTARIYTMQKKARTPPLSWAKWPSHNRAARVGAAGEKDIVAPRDFAVMETTADGHTRWSTDKERANTPKVSDVRSQSISLSDLSTKLGKAVRGSFARMIRSALDSNSSTDESGRRKNRKSAGYLEYPELELLPTTGGYREVQSLEQQIDNMKRSSVVSFKCSNQATNTCGPKAPLSVRLAQDIHEAQHGGDRATTPDSKDFLATPPPKKEHPITPAPKRISSPQPYSAPAAPFATPMSHISYDDCVQKHLLDENDSIKSDTTVMMKRSKSNAETQFPRQSGKNKYSTWNGRSRQSSVLLKDTREFSAELEKILAQEKEKILGDVSREVKQGVGSSMNTTNKILDAGNQG